MSEKSIIPSPPAWTPPHQDETTGGTKDISTPTNEQYYSSPKSTLAAFPRPPQSSTQLVFQSPCAACRILRRRCSAEKCILAPHFPPSDPLKFTIAHKVFGASNIIKMLQELPEEQREDAVSSLVYEAKARMKDPVYGIAGVIFHLQNQVSELQAEVLEAEAELIALRNQHANFLADVFLSIQTRSTDESAAFNAHSKDHLTSPSAGQTDGGGGGDHYCSDRHDHDTMNNHQVQYNSQHDESWLEDQSFINLYTDSSLAAINNSSCSLVMSPVWEPLWA